MQKFHIVPNGYTGSEPDFAELMQDCLGDYPTHIAAEIRAENLAIKYGIQDPFSLVIAHTVADFGEDDKCLPVEVRNNLYRLLQAQKDENFDAKHLYPDHDAPSCYSISGFEECAGDSFIIRKANGQRFKVSVTELPEDGTMKREQLAEEITKGLDGYADSDSTSILADHRAIREAILRGDSADEIFAMREVDAWPETAHYLRCNLK